MAGAMKLLIISGLSGSGKSIALQTLEDCGFYCIDNLPISLLKSFIGDVVRVDDQTYRKTAIGIDARNQSTSLAAFSDNLAYIREQGIDCQVIYMQADDTVLLKRYSETRRRHPLSYLNVPLKEAIVIEKELLKAIAKHADLVIDTSRTHYHQLRDLIRTHVNQGNTPFLSLQLQSFGYKHGVPLDTDFIFDARSLPNPYWIPELRGLTGRDAPVAEFLNAQALVQDYLNDIAQFLQKWLPRFAEENRSYLTIAIGCTGGQHRSVYLIDRLAQTFKNSALTVIVRHRELHP